MGEQDAGLSMTCPLAISENLNDDTWWNRPQRARARHGNVFMSNDDAEEKKDDAEEKKDDAEEKRIAQDGLSYTKADFIKFYGGTGEWDLAAKAESVDEFWKRWESNRAASDSAGTEVVDKKREKAQEVDEFWQRWNNRE